MVWFRLLLLLKFYINSLSTKNIRLKMTHCSLTLDKLILQIILLFMYSFSCPSKVTNFLQAYFGTLEEVCIRSQEVT